MSHRVVTIGNGVRAVGSNSLIVDRSQRYRIVVEPTGSKFRGIWRELYDYVDLLTFWTWRNIRVRYAQSVLGVGWALIQPAFMMLTFTLVFGKLARVSSDGAPYALFSLAGLIPWTFFSSGVTESTASLAQNANMISKIYFPRLILPLAAIAAKLVDFLIALFLLGVVMLWYRAVPSTGIWIFPILITLMIMATAGLGIGLTALAVQYRDIKHGVPFFAQVLMYAAPVIYPASSVPSEYRLVYAINPMVGVIEGFRSILLRTTAIPWGEIGVGFVSATLTLLISLAYFRSRERLFADVA